MRYIKPQILAISPASSAIKGGQKANPIRFDNLNEPTLTPAYEADE